MGRVTEKVKLTNLFEPERTTEVKAVADTAAPPSCCVLFHIPAIQQVLSKVAPELACSPIRHRISESVG